MTIAEKEDLFQKLETEGFEYAFMHYSDFKEIQDPKFHELRKAFVEAAIKLKSYIGYEG